MWNPADTLAAGKRRDERALTIKMNATTGNRCLPARFRARQRFSRLRVDLAFFRSAEALAGADGSLRRFKPEFAPSEKELHAIRFAFDPAAPMETLMLHFCSESMRASGRHLDDPVRPLPREWFGADGRPT